MEWLWSFSKWMTCTWNIFGMNSWNGNLIFHQTRGVSWFNVSVSQATCQTWPLSNDDDGCSSLEQSVWWWSCTFLFDGGLRSFWILMLLPLKPTYLVPEKVDALTDYTFSLPVFWWEITHQKIRSCEANLVINKFTNHIVGDPKKIPFPLLAPGSSDAMWNFSLSQHVTGAHCPLVIPVGSRLDKVI